MQDLILKLILDMFSGPTNFLQAYAHHMQHYGQSCMHPKDGSWDLNKSALNWYLK